jgi:hypothetical protein
LNVRRGAFGHPFIFVKIGHTVDGRNPAPPWMVETLFGWWFGTFYIFHILGRIISSD